MGTLAAARQFALALPGTSEEPHFDLTSFRVTGKIFATAPPDGRELRVFVDESEVAACVADEPAAFEPLLWGRQVKGVRIDLSAVPDARIAELLAEAWHRRAPKRLAAAYDADHR